MSSPRSYASTAEEAPLSPLEQRRAAKAAKAGQDDSLREAAEARRRMESGEDQKVTEKIGGFAPLH